MAARILDGKELAASLWSEMKEDVARLKAEHDLIPGLAVVLVGDNPASISYVRGKQKACDEIGIYSQEEKFDAGMSQSALEDVIARLNQDVRINGILVQLPLPNGLDEDAAINALDPNKDVDGLHPVNLGRLMRQEPGFWPCTPHGIQMILKRSGIDIAGRHVVVVGRSSLVGRPVANILAQKADGANATVTMCHTGTRDLGAFTRMADILIVVAGSPGAITADMVGEGAVVIDVGVSQVEDPSRKRGYRLVGDVDFDNVKDKASAITPVPGGVGPMTITMLLYNTILAARRVRDL